MVLLPYCINIKDLLNPKIQIKLSNNLSNIKQCGSSSGSKSSIDSENKSSSSSSNDEDNSKELDVSKRAKT